MTQIPPSAPPVVTGVKRAERNWMLIVATGFGLFLAPPIWGMVSFTIYNLFQSVGLFYDYTVFYAGFFVMAMLAYLLTHRAGAVLWVLLTAGAANVYVVGGFVPYLVVEMAVSGVIIEGLLALSLWRTRNLLILWVIVMIGIILPEIRLGFARYIFDELAPLGLGVFAGLAAMLMISAVINGVTGIGRRP